MSKLKTFRISVCRASFVIRARNQEKARCLLASHVLTCANCYEMDSPENDLQLEEIVKSEYY